MNKKIFAILFVVILLGFALRLYRFDNPIADWHSWRQADTSSVSRNFVQNGFDVLHPTYHDLSNVPSGLNNPSGYRFVEFPVYNVLQGGLYSLTDILSLEEWGRLITIFSSLSSALLIFLILRKHQNEIAGLIGAFFFATLPFNVFFGRTILPDVSTAAAILAGIYFFDVWISSESKKLNLKNILIFALAIFFTSLALLLKPFAAFFTLPMIYLAFDKYRFKVLINPYLWVFAILSLLPLIGWRYWMMQFPEGIPVSSWLFNEGNIRFKGSYFYWIFAERIGKLILGYWGVVLLVLGLITKVKEKPLFISSFALSSIIYLIVIARGNVQHDYYQILIMPTICIFLGIGGEALINRTREFGYKYAGLIAFSVITFFTLLFGWYYVRDFFNINNNSIVMAGEAVDKLTPKDAKVIANYNGDTSFLYQTKRSGWASYQNDLPIMVSELGADYLVLVNPTESDFEFAKDYKIVEQKPEYVIFDLRTNP